METIHEIEKIELKNRLKKLLISHRPQDLVHATNKRVYLLCEYINGFINCMNKFSETPMNDSEVEDLIDEELLKRFNELLNE